MWAAIHSARNEDADPWRDPPPIFATLPKGVQADADEDIVAERDVDEGVERLGIGGVSPGLAVGGDGATAEIADGDEMAVAEDNAAKHALAGDRLGASAPRRWVLVARESHWIRALSV